MRLFLLAALLLCATLAAAWDKLDHEIFELYDDIKTNEPTTDWYALLSLTPKASTAEINKAYRQLSRKYHPDKLQHLPDASQQEKRFQRLSLVVNILRDPESRKKYNFFRKNGVPSWRGTAYMYRRWRPGFATVLVGLLVFTSGMQYLFAWLSFWRARQRVEEIEKDVRAGKLRREDLVFDSAAINPYAVPPPAITRLLVVRLPLALLAKVGVYRAPEVVEDIHEDAEARPDDALRRAVDSAINSADEQANGTFADRGVSVDAEIKAKKAAKKAAKNEARRRRANLV
ncbi:hypothetical protein GGI05_001635 [Coemansia sp. RSA 2603]|nr:hypothetical protein GGI05_001635 [Coemansia sp. RSA 2603]